ncbi:LysE family translocator [uncultured Thalassospira sp.]|jgi:threonine/homoserine/homoserine lactone efflux protein|uniref:LysE family translocator n=1 Tax=uncultured Thalassospira sp. TaxID=404382 RepID=UPI0030DDA7CF|tara:strand:- start:1398 stop:2033 length:636 start_codon:yes stop_codon:yes gene_type:complete
MTFEIWATYLLACAIVLAIPGPTIMLVVSYALGKGRQTAWATVPGVALGDLTAMTVSLMGAGALLATSAAAFSALKLVGAVYLVYLGVKMWREKPHQLEDSDEAQRTRPSRMFLHAYVVTALNPKGIIFFIAFVPQFIIPHQPALPQFAILIATFVSLATVNILLWALAAGTMREKFRSPRAMQLMGRAGGSVLIAAGLITALARRASATS